MGEEVEGREEVEEVEETRGGDEGRRRGEEREGGEGGRRGHWKNNHAQLINHHSSLAHTSLASLGHRTHKPRFARPSHTQSLASLGFVGASLGFVLRKGGCHLSSDGGRGGCGLEHGV